MSFFDQGGGARLGHGVVGSAFIGSRQVIRPKIAISAVGTSEHGTLNLAKGIGTVSSASIGSLHLSYGSAGTFAGRVFRSAIGSFARFAGTVRPGGLYGTLTRPISGAVIGSFRGTVAGRIGSFARFAGTLRPGGVYGTLARPVKGAVIGSFRGTVAGRIGSFARFAGTVRPGGLYGTLTRPVAGGQYGSFGTVAARQVRAAGGSFGGLMAGTLRARGYGSLMGTMYAHVGSVRGRFLVGGTLIARAAGTGGLQVAQDLQNPGTRTLAEVAQRGLVAQLPVARSRYGRAAAGSVGFWLVDVRSGANFVSRYRAGTGGAALFGTLVGGTVPAARVAAGTLARSSAGGAYGSFGTVASPRVRAVVGSFARFAGTMRAGGITTGTVARSRLMQAVGTHLNGSMIGGTTKTRYVVWPTAFPSTAYAKWMSFELRGTNARVTEGQQQFHGGFLGPKAGSSRWYVGLDSVPSGIGSVQPIGTIWLFGA